MNPETEFQILNQLLFHSKFFIVKDAEEFGERKRSGWDRGGLERLEDLGLLEKFSSLRARI